MATISHLLLANPTLGDIPTINKTRFMRPTRWSAFNVQAVSISKVEKKESSVHAEIMMPGPRLGRFVEVRGRGEYFNECFEHFLKGLMLYKRRFLYDRITTFKKLTTKVVFIRT